MAWITLTADDVARRLAAAELIALKSAAKAAEQDGEEILSEAIADVVTKVRGYVAGCSRNKLGSSGTVPDELKSASLALVREFLFTRLPGMKSLYDELRQKETDRAYDDLRAAAACKLAIVPPETAADEQPAGSPVELISGGTRRATRDRMRGLL